MSFEKNIFLPILLGIAFFIAVLLFSGISQNIKKDLVWFNNSDQNAWVIYSALDFNDGQPSKYISHPGVATSFIYGPGFRLLNTLGKSEISKSSDFKDYNDPVSLLPDVYKKGGYLSVVIVFFCSIFIGLVAYFITGNQVVFGAYAAIMTLFSGGFLFQSVMLRNELTTSFYFSFSLLLFCAVFYRQKQVMKFYTPALLTLAGFFFGLSYFSKSQVVLSTVLFFIFAFYIHWQNKLFYHSKISTSIAILLGHILIATYLWQYFSGDFPLFWMLILLLFIVLSLVSISSHFFSSNQILSFSNIISQYGLGFVLAIPFILNVGLKGELKGSRKVLEFTSLYTPNKVSIQSQTIDKDFDSILGRFLYFLQHYLVESTLLVVFLFAIYLLFRKERSGLTYLLSIALVVLACYLNSMRANLALNMGRSVFKYMIFIDIGVILVSTFCYYDILKRFGNKILVHAIFWLLLVGMSFHTSQKMKKDVNWGWTTFADLVYPERWLLPGNPPVLRKLFREKYKGFNSGHDRVVFGDEMERTGKILIPGGENHLKRVHKLSMEPYWNRLKILIPSVVEKEKDITDIEQRILQYKFKLFKQGDDYHTILDKTIQKRKQLYRKVIDKPAYLKYMRLIEKERITVPF